MRKIIRGAITGSCLVIVALCVLFNNLNRGIAFASRVIPTTPDPSTVETAPDGTTLAPVEPVPPAGEMSQPVPTTQAPVDYSDLSKQITIAGGLDVSQYDSSTWELMQTALSKAQEALADTDLKQKDIDKCCEKLKAAISELRLLDRTALKSAIDAAAVYEKEDVPGDFAELFAVRDEAKKLMDSCDQAAIDEASAKLSGLIESLRAKMDEIINPTVVVEKEVEKLVEIEPADDYCNIVMHKVWPVLFFVSLAFNLVLAAVIILRILNTRARAAREREEVMNPDDGICTEEGLKYPVLVSTPRNNENDTDQDS